MHDHNATKTLGKTPVQRRRRSYFLSLLTMMLPVVMITLGQAQTDNPVIIQLDTFTITQSDFERHFNLALRDALMLRGLPPTQANLASVAITREAYLDELVLHVVMLHEARRRGFVPTDAEVEAELAEIRRTLGSNRAFEDFLETMGFESEAHVRAYLEEALATQRLREALMYETEVTEQEIHTWYDTNQAQFRTAEGTVPLASIHDAVAVQLHHGELKARLEALRAASGVQVYEENLETQP